MLPKNEEIKLYIEAKKRERTKKGKLELLEKKKLAEERKKKLDQLKKTTRELAIASSKQKNIHVQDECKIGIDLPTESNEPKVDQTWSPPPKIKSFKKPLEALKNIQKKSINGFKITDECSNDTKDIISTCTSSKISKKPSKMSTAKLIDPKPQIRDVTKPENLFCKLKYNDDYQLFGKNLFDTSMPKLIDTDTDFVQKNNNDVTLLNESYHDNGKQVVSIKPLDIKNNNAKSHTGLQLPIRSHQEIMKTIDNLEELQESLFDQLKIIKKPVKNNYSKSTQTENLNVNHIETKNCLDNYKSPLIDEPVKPKSNNLSSIENNNCEEKINIKNNDKLSTRLNVITQEYMKRVLKYLNYCSSNNLHNTCIDLNFDENNSNNKSSHCFPEIHDEVQAELDTLDQLNDSLCDIERMSCDMSIKSNEQTIELNDHCLKETTISANSEQSDRNTRIIFLQEQLEARKLESFRLEKEQKKLKLEKIKAKEQDLLKQINLYDKKIEESRKMMVEIKKKNMHVSKSSMKNDSSSPTNSNLF